MPALLEDDTIVESSRASGRLCITSRGEKRWLLQHLIGKRDVPARNQSSSSFFKFTRSVRLPHAQTASSAEPRSLGQT
jgi:hypothetical protein